MMPSHPKVTEEIRAAYRSDGVVKIPGAVSGEWLSEIAVMADEELAAPGQWVTDTNPGAKTNRLFTSRYRWKTDSVVNRYVHESGVAPMACLLYTSPSPRD